MKCKIVEIKKGLVTLENDKKEKVYVSLYKQGFLFLKLERQKVGDEVTIDTDVSNKGNLYCTDSTKNRKERIQLTSLEIEEAMQNQRRKELGF